MPTLVAEGFGEKEFSRNKTKNLAPEINNNHALEETIEDISDPTSLNFFDRFDEEFNTNALEKFKAVDANDDGLVDADELKAGLKAFGIVEKFLDVGLALKHDNRGIPFKSFKALIRVQTCCKMLDEHFDKYARGKDTATPAASLSSKRSFKNNYDDVLARVENNLTVVEYTKKSIHWWDNKDRAAVEHELLFARPLNPAAGTCIEHASMTGSSGGINSSPSLLQSGGWDGPRTRWVNLEGLDSLMVRKLAVRFKLDPIAIEDALQVEQRPKMDKYDHGYFVVVPMLHIRPGKNKEPQGGGRGGHGDEEKESSFLDMSLETEAVSIFVVNQERTIVTIQEKEGDCWGPLRRALGNAWAKVKRTHARMTHTKNLSI